jgi:hypothetical protein
VVFRDDERPGRYWLADGWHRLEAQRGEREDLNKDDATGYYDDECLPYAEDPTEVDAEIRPGGKLAAMFYAAGANTTHGRRRNRFDAIAAAKVAIRALLLQTPDRRPTIEAVKTTAHVGTEIAQWAFTEFEKEQKHRAGAEAAALPPKDPRGGARVSSFVPQGTIDAHPDLDENGMLPVVDLDGEANAAKAHEMVKTIIPDAFAKGPSPGERIVEREDEARGHVWPFDKMSSAVRETLAIPAEEAAESWLITKRTGDLAEMLDGIAGDLTAYAAAVRAAKPERPQLVAVADTDECGAA